MPGLPSWGGWRMSDPSRLRVAVVGVGYMGQHHARILQAMPGVDLVAVADVDSGAAQAVGASVGAQPLTDMQQLIGHVDAVTVAVPTGVHHAVSMPLLEANIPVLVEKPIAATLDQADEMVAAAEEAAVTLAVGHSERYNPAITTALPLVTSPRFIEIHRLASFPARGLDVDVVFDVMIHDLDVLLACVDAAPESIEAVGVPVLTDRTDIANARIRFDDGCIANLTASRISRERVRKLRFFQQDSYLSVDCAMQQVESWRVSRGPGREPEIDGGSVEVPAGEPLECELVDFVSAVKHGVEPKVTGTAGRRALALAEEVALAIAPDRVLPKDGPTL